MLLAFCLMLSAVLPAAAYEDADDAAAFAASDQENSEFLRIFHLDCGRKYFTVKQIEDIIDQLAENHYTHIELAFGNDGLRFLLDDMSLTVNGKEYSSNDVSNAIKAGNTNTNYHMKKSVGELAEKDMDDIIAYADKKGIGVIPMFDIPGHTNTLVLAMESLSVISSDDYYVSNTNSKNNKTLAFDVSKSNAVEFTEALLKKYVDYLAETYI